MTSEKVCTFGGYCLNHLNSGTDTIDVHFRSSQEQDLNLIFDSWLKEFRLTAFGNQIESDVYYPNYRKHIGRIIRASQITIACNPGDHDQIYGYAVHRKLGDVRVVSWLCIKATYRAVGLGKRLFQAIGGADVVTHLSKRVIKTQLKTVRPEQIQLPDDIVYNPFVDLFLIEVIQ